MYKGELVELIPRPQQDLAELNRLITGLKSEIDPVSWRTAVITSRELLAPDDEYGKLSINPDEEPLDASSLDVGQRFIEQLLSGTPLENLIPEFICAVYGLDQAPELTIPALDAMLLNGRHAPEGLLYDLADELIQMDQAVAVVNPVGHYGDQETRIIGPRKLNQPIDNLVFLASTQSQDGGDFGVLTQVLSLIGEPQITNQLNRVSIVIPMFGGSRGHRRGQDKAVGKEIYQAEEHPKNMSASLQAILKKHAEQGGKIPEITIYSVDIHNQEWPAQIFEENGFKFESILPSPEYAQAVISHLDQIGLVDYPMQVVASDKGARLRTEELATAILLSEHPSAPRQIDVLSLDKNRVKAGEVEGSKLTQVVQWSVVDGQISKQVITPDDDYWNTERVAISSDDMIDTVGTQEKNGWLLRNLNHRLKYLISIATHGVLSKGLLNLNRAPVDHFFISNTLRPDGLLDRQDVTIINVAPAIARALQAQAKV